MVAVDSSSRGPELRKKLRRSFHYRARILLSKKGQPRPCSIEDVSEAGARIVLQDNEELPERFLLLLTACGVTRVCRQVWRDERIVGVEFVESERR
jgi:PilZ domain-containing protein